MNRFAHRTAAGCLLALALLESGAAVPAFNIEQRTTEPLLRPNQPASWDQWIGFLNVIRTNDTWHLWYNSLDTNYVNDQDQRLCYASSTNGVDWVKPALGRVNYHGSTSNNIIQSGGVAGAFVFWDGHTDRYRMTVVRDVLPTPPEAYVVFGLDSSNGLDWVEYPDPIFNLNSDTQTTCFWDVDRYRFYPRMWANPALPIFAGTRTIGYCESTTFTNFPAPTQILAPDALDPPNSHYYNNAATKLAENLYVMFISVYEKPGAETQKPHLAVSTNGVDFVRIGHAPVLPLGVGTGSFDSATIYVGPGCTPGPRPDTYWFYYVGNTVNHADFRLPNHGGLGRFLLTMLPEADGGASTLTYKTGLLTWLRADDLDADRNVTNNPADGTPVTLWKDSNNAIAGNHAAQTNAINQPTYRATGGPNNTPLVQFDGTNDYLQFPSIAYSNWTLFIVGRMPAGPSGTALAFADYGPNGTTYPALHMYRLTGTGAFRPRNRDRTNHDLFADDTNGWSRFAIRSAWVTNAAMNYRVVTESNTYAGAGAPVAGFAPAAMAGDQLPTLGDLPPATGAYAANLELSEFLLYDHTLSDTDRAAVEDYLKVKYYPDSTNPAPPTASFSATPVSGTVPLAVDFSDASTGTITNRAWDFGDGQATNTTATSLTHTYTNVGNFTVTLTASGPLGTSTVTRADYISVLNLPLYWGSNGTRFNIEERTTAPLMVADQPWESRTLGFLGVIETNGAWHCWYASIDTNYVSDDDQLLCYATSSNGVDWVKPNLGRVSYNGSTANNIVLRGGGAGAYVFWDSHADRYRMTSIRNVSGNFVIFGKDSSNGLDWVENPTPIFPFNADTQNACMWDGDRYRLYPRMWTGGIGTANSFRMVGYSESTTFSNFPAPAVILATDALDPPKADFYNSAATKLADSLYVMFPSAFYSINNGATGESAETVVPHLAASMNGRDFDKIGHAPAVPLGGPGVFDSGSIYVGPGCVPGPRPNTWWFYYVGNTARHNQVLQGSYKGGLGRFLLTVLPEDDNGRVKLTTKTGLLTWLRADDLDADRNVTNNPADGTPVARWKDSHNAAAGYHGAQTNALKQPVYRTTGGPNGMPRVEFDGTDDFLELPTIAYSGWTVFMVGRIPTGPAAGTNTLAFADYGPGAGAGAMLGMYRMGGTSAFTASNRDGTSHTAQSTDTNGWSQFAIRSAWVSSSTMNYQVTDGSNTYTGAGTAAAGYTPASFQGYHPPMLGALPPAGGNNANLELCEFLLYDRTLSAGDRTAVEDYLKEKYYPADTNPAPPTAAFTGTPTTGPAPLAVDFTDTSTGTITNRAWDFGDGQTTNTTAKALAHSYAAVGTFTVTLTASGPLGTSTVTRVGYITVQGRPLYWDSDGATAGGSGGNTANGTWGVEPFWNTSSAGGAGTFLTTTTDSDDLFFSAGTDVTGASLVTIAGTQTAASLTVQEGSITLTGGVANVPAVTITGANSALRVTANDTLGGVAGNVINLAGGGNTTPCRLAATVGGLVLPNNLTWNGYSALGAAAVTPFTLTGTVTMKGNVTLQPDSGSSSAVLGNIGDEGAGRKLTLYNNQGTLTLRLAGNNTFSGEFVYDARVNTTLEIGRDTAFGVGLVKAVGNLNIGTIKAVDAGFGAARTYANHVQFAHAGGSCVLAFDGSHTFNGQATLNGTGRFQLNANSTLALPGGLAELGGPRTLTLVGGGAGNRLLIGAVPVGVTNYAALATVPANNTVIAAGNDALGTNLAATVFTAGATLGFQGNVNYAAPKAITIGGAGPAGEGGLGAIRNFSGNNTFAGPITFSAATTTTNDSGSLTLNGVITDGASAFGLTHNGGGTLALGNANTYDGVTSVKGGVLRLNDTNALPGGIGAAGGTSALTLAGGVLGLGASDFSRALGTGIAQVQWTTNGGFSAYGADRVVNLGGAGATVAWSKGNFVPTNSALLLSAADATHRLDFQNPINLTNAVRTVQVDNGAATIDARLSGVISSTTPASGGLIKTGAGTLQLTATNTYTGLTSVNAGTLLVEGAQTGALAVAADAVLGGAGSVGAVSGAGWVSPGGSPGILTASQLDPAGGLDFAFELTATGSPDYGNPGASSNDVLRITHATTPFAAPLTSTNVVHIYFNVASLTGDDTFRGAWYTDNASLDFLGELTNATIRYYVKGDGLGAHRFNGVNYYTLATYNQWMTVTVTRVNEDGAQFAGTDGFITQFGIATPPPPATIISIW